MREVDSKYSDPVSHQQMFEIVAREAIEALEKEVKELDLRIDSLELGRKAQIQLNEDIRKRIENLNRDIEDLADTKKLEVRVEPDEKQEKKSIFRFWK